MDKGTTLKLVRQYGKVLPWEIDKPVYFWKEGAAILDQQSRQVVRLRKTKEAMEVGEDLAKGINRHEL